MKSHARVVIVGGGIVGVSIAYHLTKFGWTDVALIELRSTNLIGWNFGDVSNLFLSLGRDDLAAGRFDRVVAETPN